MTTSSHGWLSRIRENIRRPHLSRNTIFISLVLIAVFSSALLLRVYPVKYGFYLHEYDPYFDYYATSFLVDNFNENGLQSFSDYFSWVDYRTWYPEGRQVAASSQVGLHFTGAILYLITHNIFAVDMSLYDFLVLLPIYLGAFTTIIIFFLVRKIAGNSGGMLAALIISFSPPIILRGSLGWFKSEPLALFLSLGALFLFLSIYSDKINWRGLIWRSLFAGVILGFANTSWGGTQYFGIVFGLFFIVSPFIKTDLKKTMYSASLFVPLFLFFSAIFPRPGPSIVFNPIGIFLISSFIFTLIAYQIKITFGDRNFSRHLLKIMLIFIILTVAVSSFGLVSGVSGRYYTVIFPFLRSSDPLVESVAEHFVPTGIQFFNSYGVLTLLGIFGAYIAFKKRNIYSIFALVLAISGIYIASSFSRLMVFSSISIAVLSAIGLVTLSSLIFRSSYTVKIKKKAQNYGSRNDIKLIYAIFFIFILTMPVIYPINNNWRSVADQPVSIANAGASFKMDIPDWREALDWISENTPQDAVFISWWDYGYWLTVMGNRTSIADNATINSTRIAQIGRLFMSNDTEALPVIHSLIKDTNNSSKLRPGYVVTFIAGQIVSTQDTVQYVLGGGGDESKKQWFIKIGGFNSTEFLFDDNFTPNPNFWENTIIGKMWPVELYQYIDQSGRYQGKEYAEGYTGIYTKNLRYTDDNGPLKLVFMSSGLDNPEEGKPFAVVMIYEIIK